MTTTTMLKLGQIAGVLLLAAAVACFVMRTGWMAEFFLLGTLLYGGCRLASWLRSKEP